MSELKECPFCGSEVSVHKIRSVGGGRGEWVKVVCRSCGVSSPWSDDYPRAVEIWNRRV